jgi:hypothetical protein
MPAMRKATIGTLTSTIIRSHSLIRQVTTRLYACTGDFCPNKSNTNKLRFDPGSLGPTSNNTSAISDGIQGSTGSASGGDIGSVGYNGDNGGTGIGGSGLSLTTGYSDTNGNQWARAPDDDDPDLQPIVLGPQATHIAPPPDPGAVQSTLGPESAPLAGGIVGKVLDLAATLLDVVGLGADDDGPPPSTPVGRAGSPMNVEPGTNSPTTINGTDYSGHAIDQMQGRGVTPSAVEDAIQTGIPTPGNTAGTTVYYSQANNVWVVVSSDGKVITVIH